MNSSDSQSEPPNSTELPKKSGASPDKSKKRKKKWQLNEVAFNKLLECFSTDRDTAAVQYDLTWRKVVRFFEWRHIVDAESCADETMNRVARRVMEGQKIDKLTAYIFGVASLVFKEVLKQQTERPTVGLDDAPPAYLRQDAPEPVDPDIRLICFDRCMEELGPDKDLILAYNEGEGREKIENRLALARKLKIPLNALRIRVCRIKRKLEDCIAECLENARSTKQIAH